MSNPQKVAAHPSADKKNKVEKLAKLFAGAKGVFLVDFTGLNSVKTTELRRKIKETGSRYVIAKNTLAMRASAGTPAEGLRDLFKGTTGLAVNADDPAVLAKALHAFQKENAEFFKFKGGVIEGARFGAKELEAVATLPSKDQMRAMLIGTIQAPAAKLARLLVTPGTQVARCVGERGRQPG